MYGGLNKNNNNKYEKQIKIFYSHDNYHKIILYGFYNTWSNLMRFDFINYFYDKYTFQVLFTVTE